MLPDKDVSQGQTEHVSHKANSSAAATRSTARSMPDDAKANANLDMMRLAQR